MAEIPFEARLQACGLRLPAAEVAELEALVRDMDAAAATVRAVERGYWEEPLSRFPAEEPASSLSGGDRLL